MFKVVLLAETPCTKKVPTSKIPHLFSAVLLFLSICIFGAECWDRDWLLYPNYNYVSWSYAFATFSTLGHIIASIFMYIDCTQAKERKERNKALIMQMQAPAFSSIHGSQSYHMGGSGYI